MAISQYAEFVFLSWVYQIKSGALEITPKRYPKRYLKGTSYPDYFVPNRWAFGKGESFKLLGFVKVMFYFLPWKNVSPQYFVFQDPY